MTYDSRAEYHVPHNMDLEISLNPSDNDLFEDDSPGIPETAPSPIISRRQQTRPRSTIYDSRGSRHLFSDHSDVVGPSPSNNPRGRSRSRRPRDIVPPQRRSSTRSRSSRSNDGQNQSDPPPPRQHYDGPHTSRFSDRTVARPKQALTQLNICFHQSDRKATLLKLLTDAQQHTSHDRRATRAFPGFPRSGRRDVDDVMTHNADRQGQSSTPAPPEGQVVSHQVVSHPPPPPLPIHAHASFHPSISSSSLAPAFPSNSTPATLATQSAPTAGFYGGANSQNFAFPPVSAFPPLLPYPPPPHNPYATNHPSLNAPPFFHRSTSYQPQLPSDSSSSTHQLYISHSTTPSTAFSIHPTIPRATHAQAADSRSHSPPDPRNSPRPNLPTLSLYTATSSAPSFLTAGPSWMTTWHLYST
ncbi:uncharacterized protein LOC142955281 [Anarhichas minor]|uniref:uncharacterized protein LOC142955281 n=1 Tax=Anarhichas minor TaxID=65739 RepID=UPI003F740F88